MGAARHRRRRDGRVARVAGCELEIVTIRQFEDHRADGLGEVDDEAPIVE